MEASHYEILKLGPDASAEQIKRSYYVLARDCHPDRNPDDPEAETRFKRILAAYQVLSNEERRRKYDYMLSHGLAMESEEAYDQQFMLSSLFGGPIFQDLTGDLEMMQTAQFLESQPETDDPVKRMSQLKAFLKAKTRRQAAILSHKLIIRIEPFVCGSNWEVVLERDVEEKLKVPGGAYLLSLVGSIYDTEAKKYLGRYLGLQASVARIKEKGHMFMTYMSVISNVLQAEMLGWCNQGGSSPKYRMLESRIAECRLTTVWKYGLLDIEYMVRKACSQVLHESNLPSNVVNRRARALEAIGSRYIQAAGRFKVKHMSPASILESTATAGH